MTTHNKISEPMSADTDKPAGPADAPDMISSAHSSMRTDEAMGAPMQQPSKEAPVVGSRKRPRSANRGSAKRPRDVMGDGHEAPAGSDAMGDRHYEPSEARPTDVMGEDHEAPPWSDAMGDRRYQPSEHRPTDVMGDGHEAPAGSDAMGDRHYRSDGKTDDEIDP